MKKGSYFIKICCLSLVGIILVFESNAQKQPMYPVSDIPVELLKNSNAVIRKNIKRFEVVDIGKGKSYRKYVVTILNKKADRYAEVRVGYDKLSKISSLKARSYDKSGRLIEQLKNKDIKDLSSYDGFSIYSDNRMKYFDLRYPEYPYTIEYVIEKDIDGLFFFPGISPIPYYNISAQEARLEIVSPQNYTVRYKEMNLVEPLVKEEIIDGKKILSWEFYDFPAIEREPLMPYRKDILPTVLTAPSEFEMEGYAGDMSAWKTYGLWNKKLNEGRDQLPEVFANEVKELIHEDLSRTEKIQKIYEYLQSTTRYVSIQMGIGGWQSFPATDVATNGYGDCKALTTYTKAMLKTAGIDSYYTLVSAGTYESNIETDFPSNQFNHAFLCVPNYQDTIWLECTSQDNPFGYLGTNTGDRDVLVINEDGGTVVHTKIYHKEDNRQNQRAVVELKENGSAQVSVSVRCTGLQYDNYSGLLDIGKSEQKKWLFRNLDIPSFDLIDFKFTEDRNIIPEVGAEINVSIQRFASVSGKRLFFQPNVFNKSYTTSIPQKERIYDFVLKYAFEDTDTVEVRIPQGYHMEFIPEKTIIESPYGKYESQVIPEEGKLLYIRKYSKEKGTFPSEDYVNYVKFMNKIAEADKTKLVLVKST